MDRVEDLVVEHYKTIAFAPQFIEQMGQALEQTVADEHTAQRLYDKHIRDQLAALDTKEANLIALTEDGELPQARIRTRLTDITREREKLKSEQGRVQQDLSAAASFLASCLELLRNPYEMYRGASDKVRRRLNQAIFKRIYVFNDEITGHELQPALAGLHAIQAGVQAIEHGSEPDRAGMLA